MMDLTEVVKQADILAKMHIKLDLGITNIWVNPHPEEIRLVEVTNMTSFSGEVYPFTYASAPEMGLTLPTCLILLHPREWEMIKKGELSLPVGWEEASFTSLYDGEDPRKTGLKNGLRQLNIKQLKRVIEYQGEMVLDEYNYYDGMFCPLAVALGLDKTMQNPSHDRVFQTLTDLGYDVYNTRGIVGTFYTDHRKEDLLEAAQEVLEEKLEQ
jgi:hypothetical protein